MKIVISLLLICIFCYSYYSTVISSELIENCIEPLKYIKSIPTVIYRTFNFENENKLLPSSMNYYCHKKWLELNPDYSMLWFTNKECDLFVNRMGDRIYNAYVKIKPGAFKSDLWRACILYRYGGVYIDSFATPNVSLNNIINRTNLTNNLFIASKDVDHFRTDKRIIAGIHNGFMIVSKNHPFLRQYIEDMVEHIEENYYGEHFLDITGPFCLMRSVNKVNGNLSDKKPTVGLNHGQIPFYLFKYNLNLYQTITTDENELILTKKFSLVSFLHEKIIKQKKGYKYIWFNKEVYKV